MSRTESIRGLAEPIVAAAELDLWDVEVADGVIRVLVDRPTGVDLDALTQASRGLSAMLDAHEELLPPGRYELEVSSPGIERTLRTPSQYQRYQGSEIAVKLVQAVVGSRRLQGTLLEATEQAIVLQPEGSSARGQVEEPLAIDYSNIQRAHLVVSWSAVASAVPGRPKPNDRARSRAGAQRKSADAGVRVASGPAPEPKDA